MYRLPYTQREVINEQIEKMLEDKIIEPSKSPWNSPLLVVPKKPGKDGKKRYRVVVDYRELNKVTIGDAHPLPRIEDILDQLGHARYYTSLDLASGYHQIKVSKKDREKTAFSTPLGHYQFIRLPFGLSSAPATFQRLMNHVLSGLSDFKSWAYLDDCLVVARNLESHEQRLREVFEKLRQHNLKLQPEKCCFLQKEIVYVGHKCSAEGVKPDPNRVKCVQEAPVPKTTKQVQSFLGLANYYRKFIKNFAQIALPLNEAAKEGKKFVWTAECQIAFEKLKEILTTQPLLVYPDFEKPFILTTDASNEALGAVLSQGTVGEDKPIAYASRKLSDTEKRYSTIEKELLAIVWAVQVFRCYLYGRKFTVYTDHKPLKGQVNVKDPTSRIIRLRHKFEEYEFTIE